MCNDVAHLSYPMTQPDRSSDTRAELSLVLTVAVWAANYPLAKFAISGLDPFVFNGIRYVVAALVLMLIFFSISAWRPVARSDWPKLIGAGVVANILYQMMFIVGLSMTTAGNSAILLATSPLWTVVINARIHKAHISHWVWLGMAISLCGILMIVVGSGEKLEVAVPALLGDLICLGAAFLWAFSTNLQKPLLSHYAPTQVAFVMVSVGAVGLSVVALPATLGTAWTTIHWSFFLAAIASGALSIGVMNAVWSYGVKRLGPGRTANFGNLVPVLALLISYIALNEQLTLIQIGGAAMTLCGVLVARR